MARFSVGGDEDGNEDRPSNNRPLPKKPRISSTSFVSLNRPNANVNASNSGDRATVSTSTAPQPELDQELRPEESVSAEEESEGESVGESDNSWSGSSSEEESEEENMNSKINGAETSAFLNFRMRNKCASCCWPIGYNRCRAIEKVLESVKITCRNMPHGCKETLSYSKKLAHEKTCNCAPCSCPHPGCNYVGICKSLYAHFALQHSHSSKQFRFNSAISISLDTNQNHVILQERSHSILFILNRSIESRGSFVNVVCVAPASAEKAFLYDLTATVGESSIKLRAWADCVPKWMADPPAKIWMNFCDAQFVTLVDLPHWIASTLVFSVLFCSCVIGGVPHYLAYDFMFCYLPCYLRSGEVVKATDGSVVQDVIVFTDAPPLLRLRFFFLLPAPASSRTLLSTKKRLVFLGSPQVSASVLDSLFNASSAPDSLFEIAAIVTQPPSGRDRGRKVMPSPVAQHAVDRGFPSELIFTPAKAGEESFLSSFKVLEPELCITAAYGNILPTKFLKLPSMGTVNIHPSLLPLYRGAAPVQRALQDGVRETGVSLAYTVRQLDAGPVIACEKVEIDDYIKAPELLELLFARGSELLIRELPSIFDCSAKAKALAQDESKATLAPKITPEESWLSFDQDARILHNKVRAFAGWPGTRAKVSALDPKSGQHNIIELKIITTRVYGNNEIQSGEMDDTFFAKGSLIFPCGGGTALEMDNSISCYYIWQEYFLFMTKHSTGGPTSRQKGCKCNRILERLKRPKTKEVVINVNLTVMLQDQNENGPKCSYILNCVCRDNLKYAVARMPKELLANISRYMWLLDHLWRLINQGALPARITQWDESSLNIDSKTWGNDNLART
ncbi:Methionyl-tRNA formyltransferase [Sesamum angolense]|uniref:methionyl-tRNA formyltransferase n=1 Tax=Sesamum angolense TaxID=2727404 RepID=A0AAE1WHZ2_9LAMI|nr:Methionyl-tRNA formyltransferase [Sesamum angolense]